MTSYSSSYRPWAISCQTPGLPPSVAWVSGIIETTRNSHAVSCRPAAVRRLKALANMVPALEVKKTLPARYASLLDGSVQALIPVGSSLANLGSE